MDVKHLERKEERRNLTELRRCVKVEAAVLGSPSLTVRTLSLSLSPSLSLSVYIYIYIYGRKATSNLNRI